MRNLARFEIVVREEDFVLTLQDDAGERTEFAATPEQLDAVIDALDELLADIDEDEVEDDGETYQKPLG